MNLSPEDMALFEDLDPAAPVPPAPVIESAALPTRLTGVPLIMPSCADCGADLNPDNGSQSRHTGAWKHIGCPKAAAPIAPVSAAPAAVIPPDAPPNNAAEPPPERKRKAKTATPAAETPKAAEPAAVVPSKVAEPAPAQPTIADLQHAIARTLASPAPDFVIRLDLHASPELAAFLKSLAR